MGVGSAQQCAGKIANSAFTVFGYNPATGACSYGVTEGSVARAGAVYGVAGEGCGI